uniref:Uncharacterized protein n=1 Tax=Magallana gigas TaxID=29159 RepID=A0A8W8IZP7_MAGGI
MARTEEKFECRLCFPSLTFDRKFLAKRHIMEHHSGFAFTCTGRQMIFPLRDNHTSCHGKYSSSRRMEVVRRSNGMRGALRITRTPSPVARPDRGTVPPSPRVSPEPKRSRRSRRPPSPVNHPQERQSPSPVALPARKRTLSVSSSSSSSSSAYSSCSVVPVAPENPLDLQ